MNMKSDREIKLKSDREVKMKSDGEVAMKSHRESDNEHEMEEAESTTKYGTSTERADEVRGLLTRKDKRDKEMSANQIWVFVS
ncbi:unnamed protein product [Eruca vesicaria subsp. sativa]|uniref:Uncharacterized protein n=1 Tax=Eruca vesicaria subsp. sativa TaxID=29727 RepID=A0ABC8JEH6_ERUVS|nr:unnamed protein product [Eruca vesicaria subsp. sativa]